MPNKNIFLIFFLFFPFVGFVKGIDVQPIFLIIAFFYVFVKIKKIHKNLILLFLIFMSLIATRYVFEIKVLTIQYILPVFVFAFSYIFLYTLVIKDQIKLSFDLIKVVSYCYIFVGFIQIFYPDFLVFLTSRSADHVELLISSGRGSRSLTGEPSHFGKVLLIMNFLLLFLYHSSNDISKKKLILFSFFLLFSNIILAKSAYSAGFHFLLIFCYFFVTNFKLFSKSLLLFAVSIAVVYIFFNDQIYGFRFYKIVNAAFNNPDYILGQGAIKRAYNVPIIFNNFKYFFPFGAGNSSVKIPSSIHTIFGEYQYFVSKRSLGGYADFLLKFGVFSFPFFVLYFFQLYRITISTFSNSRNVFLGLFFAFGVFLITYLDSSPTNPLLLFSLIYVYSNRNKLKNVHEN